MNALLYFRTTAGRNKSRPSLPTEAMRQKRPASAGRQGRRQSPLLRDQITVVFPKLTDTIEITLAMAVTGTITPSPLYGSPGAQAQFQALTRKARNSAPQGGSGRRRARCRTC